MTKMERSAQKGGGLKSCDEYMAYDHDCPTKCSNSKYPVRLEDDMKKSKILIIQINQMDRVYGSLYVSPRLN